MNMKPYPLYRAVMVALSGMAIALCVSLSASAGVPAPSVTATKDDGVDSAGQGDRLTYRVDITNTTGAAIENVEFSDTLDPNTTLVTGSVTAWPIAAADNYSISGNTTLGSMLIMAANGLLSNDVDPNGTPGCTGCSVTTQTGLATTRGGTVDINADGSFEYFPVAGNTMTDTFQYEITDAEGKTDMGTVSIMFPNIIWYVDNSAPAGGNGTQATPFNNLGSAASASAAGDMIYVLTGNAPAVTGLNAGIVLKNNQMLLGQGVDLKVTFGGSEVVKFPAGTAPVVIHTAGTAITLAQNNTIKGLKIGDSTNPVIGTGISGTTVGTLTVGNASIKASTGAAVNINGGNLAVDLTSVSANGGSNGIVLSNTTGSFSVNGDGANTTLGGNASGGTISNMSGSDGTTTGIGVYLNNASNVTLRRMSINGTNQNFGIYGTNVNNFTMEYSTVGGTNGTSTPNHEGSVIFDNVFGSSNAILGSVISGGIEDNVRVTNSSGTLGAFNITNSTIQNNDNVQGGVCPNGCGNIGIGFFATLTSNMTANISNNMLQGNRTESIRGDAGDSSTLNMTISGNTIVAGNSPNAQGNLGINVSKAISANVTFNVSNNKVGTPDVGTTKQPLINTGINIFSGASSGTMSGSVTGNVVIQDQSLANTNPGSGIIVNHAPTSNSSTSALYAKVDNNTVGGSGSASGTGNGNYGILIDSGGVANATGTTQVQLTNNTVATGTATVPAQGSTALDAIRVAARRATTACYRISGNTASTAGTGFYSFYLRKDATASESIEGLTPGSQNDATTIAYIGTVNTITGPGVGANSGSTFTGVAANSCSSIP